MDLDRLTGQWLEHRNQAVDLSLIQRQGKEAYADRALVHH